MSDTENSSQFINSSVAMSRTVWQDGDEATGSDTVARETAVALVYNGISHVVMMATPRHLQEFALGFSLSEGILDSPRQLLDFEQHITDKGIQLALTIAGEPFARLKQRRHNLTGRTGCGLCGAESLEQALTEPHPISSHIELSHQALQRAVLALDEQQQLQKLTGAAHGAAWCNLQGELLLVREDIGRHNALDKLIGAISTQGLDKRGFVLVTSRASYEMVSKTARVNIPLLAAVSAATTLAVDFAKQSGLTLVGFLRPGRHVIYTDQQRLKR